MTLRGYLARALGLEESDLDADMLDAYALARVDRVHAFLERSLFDEQWRRELRENPPGPVRTLADMGEREISALEAHYGVPIRRPAKNDAPTSTESDVPTLGGIRATPLASSRRRRSQRVRRRAA